MVFREGLVWRELARPVFLFENTGCYLDVLFSVFSIKILIYHVFSVFVKVSKSNLRSLFGFDKNNEANLIFN